MAVVNDRFGLEDYSLPKTIDNTAKAVAVLAMHRTERWAKVAAEVEAQ